MSEKRLVPTIRQNLKVAVGLFLNFCLIANPVLAQLPPISFESPVFVPWEPIQNHSSEGWSLLSGNANVTPQGEGYEGGQALKLPRAAGEAWLRKNVEWNADDRTAFIDFRIKPAAEPEGGFAGFVANGSQIAFQLPEGHSAGNLWALHGGANGSPSQWYLTPGSFPVIPGTDIASVWSRVTLRHDYDRNLWDLFIDGKLAAVNLAFEARDENLSTLEFFGSRHGDTLVDEISVQTSNMLFPDADKDGLPDAWETANGSNPDLYDRDAINPTTGRAFIDDYLASLWPPGSTAANGIAGIGNVGAIPPLTIEGMYQPVGALKGSFSVGGDGSSTYSIPIDLPKGTAGMEPKISLSYSSSGGNGVAGLGWGINGFQKITRGPKSASKEGGYDPVDFDADDRFFLDGERLICVSGAYGADGSEYRTEIDSFARITAIGNGPLSWKVETKAGLIVHLGTTAESRQQIQKGMLSWGVSRVLDTLGNYYDVEYARDPVGGQPFDFINDRISAVHYTGNVAQGLVPYAHVYFDYEERPDASKAYTTHAGYSVTKRLSKIRVATGNHTNHSYVFGYTSSYQTGRSLLSSVAKLAEDDPRKAIPATTFDYDGLKQGEAIWRDPRPDNLLIYGHGLDESGVRSVVSTDDEGRTVHLYGDVSRGYAIPGGVTIYSDTVIEFDFKSERQTLGALIGLDADLHPPTKMPSVNSLEDLKIWAAGGPPSELFRIGGSGSIKMGPEQVRVSGKTTSKFTPCFNGPAHPYSPGSGWKTFRLNAAQFGTGQRKYLVLFNGDDSPSDGIDEAVFRNVKIYRAGSQKPSEVEAIQVDIGDLTPRLRTSDSKDVGIQILDLNGDTLPDISWHRVTNYVVRNNVYSPNTDGDVYLNTGRGFRLDNSVRPPQHLPLGVNADDAAAEWIERHELLARPTDIDGDGNLDLCGAVLVQPPLSAAQTVKDRLAKGTVFDGMDVSKLAQSLASQVSEGVCRELAFYCYKAGEWTELSEWRLPFRFGNLCSTDKHSGPRGTYHLQWIDLNGDGYQDLTVFTTSSGRLWKRDSADEILGGDASAVFINKGKNGPGWIRDDSYAFPEALMGVKDEKPKDIGRRLMDVNGDGVQEIVEAWDTKQSVLTRHTYFQNATGANRWNSTPGLANPPASSFDMPMSFIDYEQVDRNGGLFFDCNGDGLMDALQNFTGYSSTLKATANTWLNHGARGPTAWAKEPADGYQLPVAMHFPYDQNGSKPRVPFGYEIADINGDGLTDIFYSNEDNTGTTGSCNFVLANTGKGWSKRPEWGAPGGIRMTYKKDDRLDGKRYAAVMELNGDGFPDLVTHLNENQPRVWYNNCRPEVLTSVTDGFGSEIQAEYRRLNDPAVANAFGTRIYEKETGPLPAGQAAVIDNRLVVSRYSEPDGLGARLYKSQRYSDLRYDRFNEASLGFGKVEALDEQTGQRSITTTVREYPFAGSPLIVESYVLVSPSDVGPDSIYPGVTPGLKLVTQETAQYAELPSQSGIGGVIRRPVQTISTKNTFDLDTTLKISTTTWQNVGDFDAYGFVKRSTVTSLDNSTVVTESDYDHVIDTSRWHLGRLSRSTVTKNIGGSTSVKTASFTYSPSSGLLRGETVQPGHDLSVTKSYGHDGFGNVISTRVSASGETRSSSTRFDSRGRFPVLEQNALGHTSTHEYDQDRALLRSTTDPGGRTVSFNYDAFGTLTRTDQPSGTKTAEITGLAGNDSVPSSVASLLTGTIRYFRAKETSGAPSAFVYLDAMGRELCAETTILRDANATGPSRYSKVYVVTGYDYRGRKISVSNPFAAGEIPRFTYTTYDLLDRALITLYPDGGKESVKTYGIGVVDGQPVTYSKVLNKNGKTLERWEDQHGRFVQSRDPSGQFTRFSYDAESRLTSVAIDGQRLLTNTFDLFGNKTGVWEANSGSSSSEYNGFGEVVSATNALGQTTRYSYDLLGRRTKLVRPGVEGTFLTSYDRARGNGIGQPWKTTGPAGYVEEVSYDSLGRPVSTLKTQFGETFTTATTYDALGRTLTSTDAGGLIVLHTYDVLSFPLSVTLAGGTPGTPVYGAGTVLWRAGAYDSAGRMLSQTLAQGVATHSSYDSASGNLVWHDAIHEGRSIQEKAYEWDRLGNLTYRFDFHTKVVEAFGYDELNRLKSTTVSSAPMPPGPLPPSETYAYDIKGNLTKKAGSTLRYDGSSPHAVSSATIAGINRSYSYDAAGYMRSDSRRTYNWTSFGQLSMVYLRNSWISTPGGMDLMGASDIITSFEFDAGGNRARKKVERMWIQNSRYRDIETTLYLGGYERISKGTYLMNGSSAVSGQTTIHRHTLAGGIVYMRTEAPQGTRVKLTTVLADHLGSTDVLLVGLWNGSSFGNVVTERQSFDPWGGRRNASGIVPTGLSAGDPFVKSLHDYDRGYTGHEQLDDSGLIHMNGRIYDPELGRFLSPDPVVQVPEYSQNFNRYSYVLNNPLNATDPSGFFLLALHTHKKLQWAKRNWAKIGPYVGIVVGVVLCWTGVGAMAGAAITGAAVGSTTAAVAGAALIGGVMGGVNAAMTGGDILKGFLVGAVQGAASGLLHGVGEWAGELAKAGNYGGVGVHVVGHGVVGGLSNEAMGGKFSDGFLSAMASAAASYMPGIGSIKGDGFGAVAARTAIAGVVGGTASMIGGGKFANGFYTAAFQHLLNFEGSRRIVSDSITEIEKIYEETKGDCVTRMRDVLRKYFKDNSIGEGLTGRKFTCNNLMDQLVKKGYSAAVVDFTFNDSRATQLQNADQLTKSVGGVIKAGGKGGIYILSIANGLHSMTVTYNGDSYNFLDQGTGWDISTSSSAGVDAQIVNITGDLLKPGREKFSSIVKVSRIDRGL